HANRTSIRVHLPYERLELSLTDARYYKDQFQKPDMERFESANRALRDGVEVLLGVGLTRPFASSAEEEPRHWLQVNAIHLRSQPGLRLSGK
ncbi:MAG: hypothetical protein WBO97_00565, partial [Tepidiformaceae bacterium]